MDIVFINGLTISTVIGVFDWEKTIKQTLIFDMQLGCDITPAASDDDLNKTLDYAAISLAVDQFCQQNTVELIETLAERLAAFLMKEFTICWVRLTINKPDAVENAAGVGVIIERGVKH